MASFRGGDAGWGLGGRAAALPPARASAETLLSSFQAPGAEQTPSLTSPQGPPPQPPGLLGGRQPPLGLMSQLGCLESEKSGSGMDRCSSANIPMHSSQVGNVTGQHTSNTRIPLPRPGTGQSNTRHCPGCGADPRDRVAGWELPGSTTPHVASLRSDPNSKPVFYRSASITWHHHKVKDTWS